MKNKNDKIDELIDFCLSRAEIDCFTDEQFKIRETYYEIEAILKAYKDGFKWKEEIKERSKPEFLRICAGEDPEDRRGEVMDEYKALEVENNVKVAVKKLREAYWSNDPDSYASQFCKAKQIIISAICFFDYTLQKEGDEKR